MTSKTSFFNYLREDLRHRVWIPALAFVVFLLGLIFSTLAVQSLNLERTLPETYNIDRLFQLICSMYNANNFMLTMVAVTGAIICGIQGFSYLTSKCQLDFYHSLPLKREQFFLIRWFNGILFYVVPAAVFSLLSCIVLVAFDFMNGAALEAIVSGFLHNLLIFLLMYHSAILACMVTGNILVSLAVLGLFSLYALTITNLVPTFMDVFYTTYASFNSGLAHYLNYLAPGWLIFKLSGSATAAQYVYTLVYTVLLLVLDLVLYRMRASESAGKAIVFPILRPVIRILIVIPVALYAGLIFGMIAPGMASFWSIFGLLVFLVLAHAVLEVIFDFDIHSAFHHKAEMLACAVFSVAFMAVFLTDVLKLDEQIPSQHSVDAVYMDLPIDNDTNYIDLKNGGYTGLTGYREDHAFLSGDDLDKAYTLLALRDFSHDSDYSEEDDTVNLNVRFVKKGGQSEYRYFTFALQDAEAALADVFNTVSYKQGHYQVFDPAFDKVITNLAVTDATYTSIVRTTTGTDKFSEKETKAFMDVLREDLTAFTYEQLTSEVPIGMVSFDSGEFSATSSYYIYPSFTKSIAWMKEHGVDFDIWKQKKVISLSISLYDTDNEPEDSEMYGATTHENSVSELSSVVITDPDDIAALYPYLYTQDYINRNNFTWTHTDVHNATAVLSWEENDQLYEASFSIDSAFDLSTYLASVK